MNPLLPVFITGAFALLGLVITKENKVSDFRQAWIDALRSEVADLLTNISGALALIVSEMRTDIIPRDELTAESRTAYLQALSRANSALFTIRLRLNPTEPESIAMLATLDEIEALSNNDESLAAAIASGRSGQLENELITQSKVVLAAEWARVKKGEPYFVRTRWLAAAFAIIISAIVATQAIMPSIKDVDDEKSTTPVGSPATKASAG